MLGLSSEDGEGPKSQFRHYDASQLLELDLIGRAVWSVPTTSDFSLSSRLNEDEDRDLLFDDGAEVVRSRARTLPVGNHIPDRKHYQEGIRPAEDFVIKYLREQKKLKLVSLLEQRLSNAAATKATHPQIEEGQHVLEHHWTFWFDYAPPNKPVSNSSCIWEKQSFEQTVSELGSFNTVEGFWSYWNQMRVGSLKDNCNLRMFQRGTRPTCEDPMNRTGGRWVARNLPKQNRDKLWSYVVMAVIGELLEEEASIQSISGVVLSTREAGDSIQLWLDGGYRYRQEMKQLGRSTAQAISNTADTSRGIIQKLQRLLFPGDPQDYFQWQPQYRVVQNVVVDRSRASPTDNRGRPPWGTTQPSAYAPHSQQPLPHCTPTPAAYCFEPLYEVTASPPPQRLASPPQPRAQSPHDPDSPVPGEVPPKHRGNADNEEYRLEKQRQIREFLADAEANPGKYTKREVRNSKRQLAMLERRQAQMEAERAGLRAPSPDRSSLDDETPQLPPSSSSR